MTVHSTHYARPQCGGSGVVTGFVIPTIAQQDDSRPLWPSCPSTGWLTDVNRLSSLPNGEAFAIIPADSTTVQMQGGIVQTNANYQVRGQLLLVAVTVGDGATGLPRVRHREGDLGAGMPGRVRQPARLRSRSPHWHRVRCVIRTA